MASGTPTPTATVTVSPSDRSRRLTLLADDECYVVTSIDPADFSTEQHAIDANLATIDVDIEALVLYHVDRQDITVWDHRATYPRGTWGPYWVGYKHDVDWHVPTISGDEEEDVDELVDLDEDEVPEEVADAVAEGRVDAGLTPEEASRTFAEIARERALAKTYPSIETYEEEQRKLLRSREAVRRSLWDEEENEKIRQEAQAQLKAGEFPDLGLAHHKKLKDIWEGQGDPDDDPDAAEQWYEPHLSPEERQRFLEQHKAKEVHLLDTLRRKSDEETRIRLADRPKHELVEDWHGKATGPGQV